MPIEPIPEPTDEQPTDDEDSDRGRTPRGSQSFWLLYRAGPMTREELGEWPSVDDRRLYDIRQFNPRTDTTAVWYLGQYHAPERVLRHWFNENGAHLREHGVSGRALTYAFSGHFEDAWARIRDEPQYDAFRDAVGGGSDGEQDQKECPKCGKPFGNLPQHLPGCDG